MPYFIAKMKLGYQIVALSLVAALCAAADLQPLQDVLQAPLPAPQCAGKFDVLFVLDANIDAIITGVMRQLIRKDFPLGSVNLGLIIFSDAADLVVSLGQFTNIDALFRSVESSRYIGGQRNLAAALRLARLSALSPTRGARPDAVPIVIVISSGPSVSPVSSLQEAIALKNHLVVVKTLAIGDASVNELLTLATSSNEAYLVTDLPRLWGNICNTGRPGQCYIWGDPHYTTLDGLHYDYQGYNCSLDTMEMCCKADPTLTYFKIITVNKPYLSTSLAVLKTIQLQIFGHSFTLTDTSQLLYDNALVSVPFTFFQSGNSVTVIPVGLSDMYLYASNGVIIQWHPGYPYTVTITVPPVYRGKLCGLCGNFDGNPANDPTPNPATVYSSILDPYRSSAIQLFANSYSEPIPCMAAPGGGNIGARDGDPGTCNLNIAMMMGFCTKLLNGPFNECVRELSRRQLIRIGDLMQDCLYDVCYAQQISIQVAKQIECSYYEMLSYTCSATLSPIDWRPQVPGCVLSCPGNTCYSFAATPCVASCDNPQAGLMCPLLPRDGCVCDSGKLFNGKSGCIDANSCFF